MSQPGDGKGKARVCNWTIHQDRVLLNLLLDQFKKNYGKDGTFKPHVFTDILVPFNEATHLNFTQIHLSNRWKNLKRTYHLYESLRSRSGWGCDESRQLPVPPDDNAWTAAIAMELIAWTAIDGTHIPANIERSKHCRYRNRKGQITQNVMAAVSFDLQFQYVGVGWEGAAADMAVLNWSLENGGFTVLQGKYYLCDLGYANTSRFLAPYRGERYHLQQYQGRGNAPYQNPKDKFNHRHAQLRNTVERAFGVVKNRFQTLKEGNLYPYRTQLMIVLACCVVHNFIRRLDGEDFYFNSVQVQQDDAGDFAVDLDNVRPANEMQAGERLRESIARELWLAG